MRALTKLTPAGLVLGLGICMARCSPALPSDRPLGRGPLAFNQQPAEEKRAAPEAVAASAEGPGSSVPDAGAPASSAAPPVTAALGADAGSGVSAAGAGASGDAGPLKLDFSGEYVGRDKVVLRVRGAPDVTTNEDPNAKTRVRYRPDGNLDVIFVASDSGNELCSMEAKPSGSAASMKPGQVCSGWPDFTSPLIRGNASFNGKQLVVDLEFPIDDGEEGEERVEGIWMYHFEGTRR